ncbi:hypothetical protein RBB50_001860 [Rhinocladiella similis]
MNPTPQERFEEASKHARLINALLSLPACRLRPDGKPDKAQTPLTLYWVIDFELNTWNNYILPILPPNATKNSRALAILPGSDFTEKPSLLADDLYPRMSVGGLNEKWSDSVGRSVMICSIILTPGQQMMFGGVFAFGSEVEAAARALNADD